MSAGSRTFLEDRIGRLSQMGGVTPFVFSEGKAKGVSTLRVRTATGLEFWVLTDRGMDIGEARFLGKSLSWQSPTGVTNPAYYSRHGLDWLQGFHGGLLCFCGLSHAGAPSVDGAEDLGLHGPISNTPAEQVSWKEEWQDDDCLFTITGKVREASVFGANLLLTRTITASLNTSVITVEDVVENLGLKESPIMALYHLNFGYPLMTGKSQIFASPLESEPATAHARASESTWNQFEEPQAGMAERVYFHTMKPASDGWVNAVVVSDRDTKDWGIWLRYDAITFPEFIEWKLTSKNHYVLGLEPANCRSLGRKAERDRGTLQFLQPGEKKTFRIEMRVVVGTNEISQAIAATEV